MPKNKHLTFNFNAEISQDEMSDYVDEYLKNLTPDELKELFDEFEIELEPLKLPDPTTAADLIAAETVRRFIKLEGWGALAAKLA